MICLSEVLVRALALHRSRIPQPARSQPRDRCSKADALCPTMAVTGGLGRGRTRRRWYLVSAAVARMFMVSLLAVSIASIKAEVTPAPQVHIPKDEVERIREWSKT